MYDHNASEEDSVPESKKMWGWRKQLPVVNNAPGYDICYYCAQSDCNEDCLQATEHYFSLDDPSSGMIHVSISGIPESRYDTRH